MMIQLNVGYDELLDLMTKRVARWVNNDQKVIELYKDMYRSMIEGGVFDDDENPTNIYDVIDNDCINFCHVIYKGEDNFNKLLELSETEHYINPDYNLGWSYIESVSKDKTMILVRY